MKKLISIGLQYFTGSTVTVYKDSHMTTASASPNSSVAKDATVTLTLTPASGYEVADIEVLAGGVTIHQDDDTVSFACGDTDVVLNVKSQKNNEYKVIENCEVNINGTKTSLVKNVTAVYSANGGLAGVDCTPTTVTLDAETVRQLVADGILIKAADAWKGTPTPSA